MCNTHMYCESRKCLQLCTHYFRSFQDSTTHNNIYFLSCFSDDAEVDVLFVDYQWSEVVKVHHVLPTVPEWAIKFPAQNYRCELAHVKPVSRVLYSFY